VGTNNPSTKSLRYWLTLANQSQKYLDTRKQSANLTYLPWYNAVKLLDRCTGGHWDYSISQMHTNDRIFLTARITIHAAEGTFSREATGTELLNCGSYGDPSSNAESMALRSRCQTRAWSVPLRERASHLKKQPLVTALYQHKRTSTWHLVKLQQNNFLDPISLCHGALKAVKVAADYHRLGNTTEPATLLAAWNKLSESEQQRIIQIVNCNAQPDTGIANELSACATKIQLESVKAEYGEVLSRQAWRLLHNERDQIRLFCNEQEEHRDEVVQAQIGDFKGNGQEEGQRQRVRNPLYKAEPQPQSRSAIQPKRTLFNISEDLERLNDLLRVGDDIQQQT